MHVYIYAFTYRYAYIFIWVCAQTYFGPPGDEQHQADHALLQHHDEQVDGALAEPRGRLRRIACGAREGFKMANVTM